MTILMGNKQSEHISIIKPLIIEVLRENKEIRARRNIYLDFFEAYPGLCEFDWKDHIGEIIDIEPGCMHMGHDDKKLFLIGCSEVNKSIAPCITKPLCIDYESDDKIYEYDQKYVVESNLYCYNNSLYEYGTKDTIFGEYTSKPVYVAKCKMNICEINMSSMSLKIKTKHIKMRKKINSKIWNYGELLPLWQKFYDNHMNHLFEQLYKLHLSSKMDLFVHALKDYSDLNENKRIIKTTIQKLIENHDLRKYWYCE